MRRFLPRSLAGQMALLIGIALLVAQLLNLALLLSERERLSLAESDGPAITRFVSALQDYSGADPSVRSAILRDSGRRGARYATLAGPSIGTADRREGVEARLRAALAEAGVAVRDVRAGSFDRPPPSIMARRGDPPRNLREVRLQAQLPGGEWIEGRLPAPRRDPLLTVRLAAATGLLYLIVLGVTVAIAVWLARPLQALTRAAQAFGGQGAPTKVPAQGPGDVRRLIEAFNAMNGRVLALLSEKDRMLGAIGHDLRTPLAAMRIRAESVEPPEERMRLIASIEETSAMLEDILVLARTGRAREQARDVDLAALLETIAGEYEDLGRPVTLQPATRTVAPISQGLVRRALRNLIDNAVDYGGGAILSLEAVQGEVRLHVDDAGPGIPPAEIPRLLEPFERGETSRNRETGGAGLGLSIVKAVAEGHGGRLTLANRPEGGLRATLHLPA